jgi:hypothetical protein
MAEGDLGARQEPRVIKRTPLGQFAPGTCGCPGGASGPVRRMFLEIQAELEAQYGVKLEASENAQLGEGCRLLISSRRNHSAFDKVRMANSGSRLIQRVRASVAARSKKAAPPAFAPYRHQMGQDQSAEPEAVGAEP